MKTPQDWNWEHTQICANDPAVHGQLLPTPQMVKFLTRVQTDARLDGIEAATDLYEAACSVMRNRDNESSWNNLQNAAARWNAASQSANNDRIASNDKLSHGPASVEKMTNEEKSKSVKRASKLKRGRPVVLQRLVRRPDRELELYEMRRYMV